MQKQTVTSELNLICREAKLMEKFVKIFQKPFNQFKLISKNVFEKSPKEKYFFVLSCSAVFLKLLGKDITEPKFKPHFLTFLPLYIITKWLVLAIYTVYYYSKHGEYVKCLAAMAISTVIVHVCDFYSIQKKNFLIFVNQIL